MAGRLLGRLLQTLVAVWLVASAVFLFSRRDATTASQLTLPDSGDLSAHAQVATTAERAALRQRIDQRLGLQLPLFYVSRKGVGPVVWHWHGRNNQYHLWLTHLLQGDWGTSYRTGQPVPQRLREGLLYTVPLTGTAALLAALLAVGLAYAGAVRPRWQRPVLAAMSSLAALPTFVVALGLLLLLANPEVLPWFPAYGLAPGNGGGSLGARLTDTAAHLALPIIVLVLTALPSLVLPLAAPLTDELHTDYATTARAKGATLAQVVRHHAFRNALLPFIAQFTDLLPALVAGAVVVETVFALPGMGRLIAAAAATRDFPVLVGGVLLVGAARLLALLLADLLYFWADPRIRPVS